LRDTLREYVLGVVEDDAAGVHDLVVVVAPQRRAVRAVSCNSRLIMYNGSIL
jgi:hypothetical protein